MKGENGLECVGVWVLWWCWEAQEFGELGKLGERWVRRKEQVREGKCWVTRKEGERGRVRRDQGDWERRGRRGC